MPNICIFIINAQTPINNTNNRFVNDKIVIFTPSFLRREERSVVISNVGDPKMLPYDNHVSEMFISTSLIKFSIYRFVGATIGRLCAKRLCYMMTCG